MGNLDLTDLYNPNGIKAVLVYSSNHFVELGDDQGFQELPKRIELWGMLDGQLMKIKGWNKTSVAMYT